MSARNTATALTDASASMSEQTTYSTLQAVPRGVLQGVAPVAMAPRYIMQSQDDDDLNDDDIMPEGVLREQDRFLPIANVAKIMKTSIPCPQGKIAKEARECVQECVSEFISFITSEAADRCQAERRKTINGEDILFAMSQLGMENYVEPLKIYLQKYRETMKGDKQQEGFDDDLLGSASNSADSGQLLMTFGGGQASAMNHFQL